MRAYTVIYHPFQHIQQGNIGFRYRLKKPVFFNAILVFRVSDIRKVSVKQEYERAVHFTIILPEPFSTLPITEKNRGDLSKAATRSSPRVNKSPPEVCGSESRSLLSSLTPEEKTTLPSAYCRFL